MRDLRDEIGRVPQSCSPMTILLRVSIFGRGQGGPTPRTILARGDEGRAKAKADEPIDIVLDQEGSAADEPGDDGEKARCVCPAHDIDQKFFNGRRCGACEAAF